MPVILSYGQAQSGMPPATEGRVRRTDMDALRILTCAAVILLHAALIFSEKPVSHLKSAVPSRAATLLFDLLHPTTLALFFVIAGWSAVASLRGRRTGQFALDRVTRLLVPLLIGIVLFGPIIKYIEMSQGFDLWVHGFRRAEPMNFGFLEFLRPYWTRPKLLTWSHLWFLAYLFLYSILLLPLLVRLAGCVARTAEPAAPTVYLPAIPMALLLVTTDGYWPIMPNLITDWPNFTYYALCFVTGSGISVWSGFEARLAKEAPRLLVLMLLGFAGMNYCGELTAGRLFVALAAWGGVGAALGFASRRKPIATPTFVYLTEATLPVYVVHHVPVLLLGLVLLPIDLPVWLKMMSIWMAAGATSLAAYHWLIRPWRPVRWLMGMSRAAPPMRRARQWTTEPPGTQFSSAMLFGQSTSSRGHPIALNVVPSSSDTASARPE